MKAKVLVSGASGLVGSWLAKKFNDSGYEVIATKRKGSPIPQNLKGNGGIIWKDANLEDSELWEDLIEPGMIFIHAAALVSFQPKDHNLLMKTNVVATKYLVDLALEKKVGYFLYVSSVGAIGRPSELTSIDEKSPWEENDRTSAYGKSKFLGEVEVWRAFEEGLEGSIINPSIVLGPADWNRSSGRLFKYVYDGGKYYTPGRINVIDVRDIAKVTLKLVEKRVTNERFILSAGSLFFKDFFDGIASSLKVNPPIKKAGKKAVGLARFFSWLKSKLTGRPQLITRETVANSFSLHEFNSDKIKGLMEFNFRPISESISWCSKEMRSWNVDK